MRHLLPGIALICCIMTPAWAETIPGADDPAFRLPFERALQGDDPTALQDIYTAAEAGNEAALRALPTVLNWLPPQGSLAEKKRYRSINGVPLDQAVAAVSPVAAAWNSGKGIEAGGLDERADILASAGEIGKAGHLYSVWFSQGGFDPPVSPQSIRAPLPVFVLANQITSRLGFVDDPSDDLYTENLLRDDRFEAWLALAILNEAAGLDLARANYLGKTEKIIAAAGISPSAAQAKMHHALQIKNWFFDMPDRRNLEMTESVAALLRGKPEFAPVEAFCHATCAETAPTCELAWLSAFAPTSGWSESLVPEVALIPTKDFFATPRGANLLFPAKLDYYDKAGALDKLLSSAEKLDACLVASAKASMPK